MLLDDVLNRVVAGLVHLLEIGWTRLSKKRKENRREGEPS